MALEDLPANLRLLCSYSTSISETCRRIGINRPLFYRYLKGTNQPTLRNLRRICDHFGVEEDEILQAHESFRHLVALRGPSSRAIDPLGGYVRSLETINPRSTNDLRPYLGYYYSYFRLAEFPGMAMRSLVKVFMRDGFVYNKTVENYSNVRRRRRKVLRYQGVVFHSGDQIFVFERESSTGKMMLQTVLHTGEGDQFSILVGLTMGVTSATKRDVSCYRAVWEYLGDIVPLRETLRECGLFDQDSSLIPEDIRDRIANDIAPDEVGLISRPWGK